MADVTLQNRDFDFIWTRLLTLEFEELEAAERMLSGIAKCFDHCVFSSVGNALVNPSIAFGFFMVVSCCATLGYTLRRLQPVLMAAH